MANLRTAYTCPVLMLFTWALMNLTGKRTRWERSDYGCYRVIVRHRYEARCVFPTWLILLECRWWNCLPGLLLRKVVGL